MSLVKCHDCNNWKENCTCEEPISSDAVLVEVPYDIEDILYKGLALCQLATEHGEDVLISKQIMIKFAGEVTALIEKYGWLDFCDLTGIGEYSRNEGFSEDYYITAKELNILLKKKESGYFR